MREVREGREEGKKWGKVSLAEEEKEVAGKQEVVVGVDVGGTGGGCERCRRERPGAMKSKREV